MNNLAGAMLYSMDLDDPFNTCGDGAFPLTLALNSNLTDGGPIASDGQEQWGGSTAASLRFNLSVLVSTLEKSAQVLDFKELLTNCSVA